MKLVDWFARGPVHVSFGRRGSGLSAIRGVSSVTLLSDSGATVEIPAADGILAGVMTAADRVALGSVAAAAGAPVFDTVDAAAAAFVPASAQALRLAGRSTAGDRGAA
ncbi:MAG: hypothetical protein RQ752_16825, partial [Thermohalobaculum sp.]|nr:hypothetical protein [Thermohalobaculum sp.]